MIITEKIQDRVAIIYGRFQPPTKGHYDMIKQAVDSYQQVFVLPVQGEAAFKTKLKTPAGRERDIARKLARSPFPTGLRVQLLQKAFPQLDSRNILKASSGSILHVYEVLTRMYPKRSFDKLVVFAGADEIEAYKRQADDIFKKEDLEHLDVEIKEYDAGTRETVSATKLREAIANPDKEAGFKSYKELAAPPLANMETFNLLRSKLTKIRKLDIEESIQGVFSVFSEDLSKKLQKVGLSKDDPDDMFDPEELKMGIAVEVEHHPDKKVAKEIAKDHLKEDPKYYTKLKEVEGEKHSKEEGLIAALSLLTEKKLKKLAKKGNPVADVLVNRLKDWWAEQEVHDIVKKGHFKGYDDAFHRDAGTSASDEPAEGDYSTMDSATTDEVAKDLWKKSKVDDDGHYQIKAKDWENFWKKYYKQLGIKVKVPAMPSDWTREGD